MLKIGGPSFSDGGPEKKGKLLISSSVKSFAEYFHYIFPTKFGEIDMHMEFKK